MAPLGSLAPSLAGQQYVQQHHAVNYAGNLGTNNESHLSSGWSLRMLIENGTLIDERFEVISAVGSGGFGSVYIANQLGLNRTRSA